MAYHIPVSSSITQVNPSQFFEGGFELSDQAIIPSEEFDGSFTPGADNIEFFIYDFNQNLLYSNTNFTNWFSEDNYETVQLSPDENIYDAGFENGLLYGTYNFISNKLSSSPSNLYFISEISSDRTEVRIQSNFIKNEDVETSYNDLRSNLDDAQFFDEFYLNFGNNQYVIGVNILLDTTTSPTSVLVKLYEPLPTSFDLKTELSVVTKVSETLMYEVTLIGEKFDIDDLKLSSNLKTAS